MELLQGENEGVGMKKILLVDDDKLMLGLHRMRLSDTYEIIETESPEEAQLT